MTVGEKIGKNHLTYAQGAVAEITAMATIGAADGLGLPVSTTHVLSSGVAGTMLANSSGLQMSTVRNLLLAWVLTLPAAMTLSGSCSTLSGSCSVANRDNDWRRRGRGTPIVRAGRGNGNGWLRLHCLFGSHGPDATRQESQEAAPQEPSGTPAPHQTEGFPKWR